MVSLIVGLVIGLAAGVIIMIIAQPKDEEIVFPLDILGDDEQIHESGFIDIPIQRIVAERNPKDKKAASRISTRLKKFRNRNRFYL